MATGIAHTASGHKRPRPARQPRTLGEAARLAQAEAPLTIAETAPTMPGAQESNRAGLITGIGFVKVFCCRRWLGALPAIVTAHYPGDLLDVIVFGSEDVPWETYKVARVRLWPVPPDGTLPFDPGDINANGGEAWAVPPTSVVATRAWITQPPKPVEPPRRELPPIKPAPMNDTLEVLTLGDARLAQPDSPDSPDSPASPEE